MSPNPARPFAMITATTLLAMVTACTGDDAGEPTPDVPLEIGPDELAIPPMEAGGLRLVDLQPAEDRPGGEGFHGPAVVSRVERGVFAVNLLDQQAASELGWDDLRTYGEPGPEVLGRPSRIGAPTQIFDLPSLIFEPLPGVLAQVSSRDLDVSSMAEVAASVSLPIEEPGAVPGDAYGVIRDAGLLPDGAVTAQYRGRGGVRVTISAASPGEQSAVLALVHQDPRQSIDLMTEASCCSQQVMVKPRERTVRGAKATIGTLTPHVVVLVLEGSDGLVMSTSPPQAGRRIPVDDRLVAIADGVRPGTPAELGELAQAADRAEADRQIAQITKEEEERGSVILAEHRVGDRGLVITSNEGGRPEIGLEGPLLCAALADGNQPACLTPEQRGSPLAMGSPAADLVFGAIGRDVDYVEVRFPKGTRPTEIFEVDPDHGLPRRVFVALLPMDDVSRLTDSYATAADAVVVALDARGREVARAPLFEHLQDGEPPETPGSTTSVP